MELNHPNSTLSSLGRGIYVVIVSAVRSMWMCCTTETNSHLHSKPRQPSKIKCKTTKPSFWKSPSLREVDGKSACQRDKVNEERVVADNIIHCVPQEGFQT